MHQFSQYTADKLVTIQNKYYLPNKFHQDLSPLSSILKLFTNTKHSYQIISNFNQNLSNQ